MSGVGFLRLKKLKGSGIVAAAARHNRRAIQAERGASASIDPTRSGLNETLQGPAAAEDVAQLAKVLMRAAGINKTRKDAVMALELVFSLAPDHTLDDRAYFSDCATWAADRFGGVQNILSVDVHRDEAAPHCHVLILPLLGGKLAGSDLMGDRRKLAATQLHFFDSVAKRHGMTKPAAKLSGAARESAARTVLARLTAASDGALRSMAWAPMRDAIESDPAPFLAALGLQQPKPALKRMKTMAQIFTSPGKGPKTQRKKPIGFAVDGRDRTLCSVGFAPAAPPTTGTAATPAELVRVRDDQLDPALYDAETGEFASPPPPMGRDQRAAAAAWVKSALTARSS